MDPILKEASELFDYTRTLRRDFHQHPELGYQEVRTAEIVARELGKLGLEVSTGIAETGVVALLEGGVDGPDGAAPVVLLRFDMDALPIIETTAAEYASQNPGVMHACGHDGHTAVGLTVARLLHAHRDEWSGVAKLVFQPAEEGLDGAKRMVAEGVLDDPVPDISLAAHVWNSQPVGWIGVTDGPAMAAAETFAVRISGKGGHGALPHLAVDPVLAAAQIVNGLQAVVARNVPPLDSAVVSVTTIHGGEAFNVIPSEVEMGGTIRTFSAQVRDMVLERFQHVLENTAAAFDCQVDIDLQSVTPAVINDPGVSARVREVVRRTLPDGDLVSQERTMGSEDMAYMMDDVPGCFLFIGSANPEQGLDAPHHHPDFDIDERSLLYASALLANAALEFLNSPLPHASCVGVKPCG
jgi:amidohydrolase